MTKEFSGFFKKKPIPVFAEKFISKKYKDDGYLPEGVFLHMNVASVGTANGIVALKDGDWVMKGNEEYYPCPDDVFMLTYEKCDDDS